jgi:hypothetical protein
MAKQTWVNVAGTWRKVKSAWIKKEGTWLKNTIPTGLVNGAWKALMAYILKNFNLDYKKTTVEPSNSTSDYYRKIDNKDGYLYISNGYSQIKKYNIDSVEVDPPVITNVFQYTGQQILNWSFDESKENIYTLINVGSSVPGTLHKNAIGASRSWTLKLQSSQSGYNFPRDILILNNKVYLTGYLSKFQKVSDSGAFELNTPSSTFGAGEALATDGTYIYVVKQQALYKLDQEGNLLSQDDLYFPTDLTNNPYSCSLFYRDGHLIKVGQNKIVKKRLSDGATIFVFDMGALETNTLSTFDAFMDNYGAIYVIGESSGNQYLEARTYKVSPEGELIYRYRDAVGGTPYYRGITKIDDYVFTVAKRYFDTVVRISEY